jgi:hypothetical protein
VHAAREASIAVAAPAEAASVPPGAAAAEASPSSVFGFANRGKPRTPRRGGVAGNEGGDDVETPAPADGGEGALEGAAQLAAGASVGAAAAGGA